MKDTKVESRSLGFLRVGAPEEIDGDPRAGGVLVLRCKALCAWIIEWVGSL